MRVTRTAIFLIGLVAGSDCTHVVAQAPAAATSAAQPQATLTPAEQETFLLKARIVSTKAANKAVTDTQRATLSDGRVTHDASIQTVDISKPVFQTDLGTEVNFKDSYIYNIAAYRLSRLLGLNNVPVSVQRNIKGVPAAVTWWVDDVMMDEGERFKLKNPMGPDSDRTAKQLHIVRVFDELIQNKDRNAGNQLWTKDWTMWMIDHTRAFRWTNQLLKPALLERCDRVLLENMRRLTAASVTEAVGKTLIKQEISALLARRDLIVKFFDAKIAAQGERSVLYTYLP